MFPGRPRRLAGFSYEGRYRYFLTLCTSFRRPYFACDRTVGLVEGYVRRAARAERFAILAHCFMPDHLHLLVQGESDTAQLRRFVRTAKLRSGRWWAAHRTGRLWQPGYYEHVLRSEESSILVARYILENPIRAGLATTVDEYPYSGFGPALPDP